MYTVFHIIFYCINKNLIPVQKKECFFISNLVPQKQTNKQTFFLSYLPMGSPHCFFSYFQCRQIHTHTHSHTQDDRFRLYVRPTSSRLLFSYFIVIVTNVHYTCVFIYQLRTPVVTKHETKRNEMKPSEHELK